MRLEIEPHAMCRDFEKALSNHLAGSYLPSGGGGGEKAGARPPVVGRAATFLRGTFKIVGVADAS